VGAQERGLDHLGRVGVEADVVEGELERLARLVDERGDLVCDVERGLPAVGERVYLDQGWCSASWATRGLGYVAA
jgi:hypothetical protein